MASRVYISGIIGANGWFEDGTTYNAFKREFEAALAKKDDIEVPINSPGGSIADGVAMYNLIAANRDRVTTINEGMAYSMGAIILSAGGKRKGYKNATTMIHNGSGRVDGNAKDLRGALEMLEKLDDAMAESIAQFSGKTVDEIKTAYFDYQDHTLTAKEALDAGILTEIIDLNSEAVPASGKALSITEAMALFTKNNKESEDGLFTRLAARFKAQSTAPNNQPPSEPITDSDMKIKLTAQLVAFAAIAGITAKDGDEVDFTAEHFDKVSGHIAGLTTQLQAATNDKTKAEGEVTRLTGELTTKTTEAEDWKGKYMKMPGAVHTSVTTTKDPDNKFENKGIGEYGDEDADYNVNARAMFGK